MAVFNTALGLWVLSSLVLGGLAAGFGYLQNHLATIRRNRELVDRDSEQLGVRFDYSQLLLKNALGPLAKTDGAPVEANRTIYQNGLRSYLEDIPETRLFPELKERSTLPLIFELMAKDHNMPKTGDHSYRAIAGSCVDIDGIKEQAGVSLLCESLGTGARSDTAFERSRWRDGRFACYAPRVMPQGRAFNCDFRFSEY